MMFRRLTATEKTLPETVHGEKSLSFLQKIRQDIAAKKKKNGSSRKAFVSKADYNTCRINLRINITSDNISISNVSISGFYEFRS